MTIQQIRKSVLVGAGIAVLGAAGLVAGRLSAGVFPFRAHHAEFTPRVFARMARALDLSDDQKGRIKAILRTHASEIETQIRASASARRAVHDAVLARPLDEAAIRAAARTLGGVHADGAVMFGKIHAEVEPILTDSQRAKIQRFRERMGDRAEAAVKSFEAFLGSGS